MIVHRLLRRTPFVLANRKILVMRKNWPSSTFEELLVSHGVSTCLNVYLILTFVLSDWVLRGALLVHRFSFLRRFGKNLALRRCGCVFYYFLFSPTIRFLRSTAPVILWPWWDCLTRAPLFDWFEEDTVRCSSGFSFIRISEYWSLPEWHHNFPSPPSARQSLLLFELFAEQVLQVVKLLWIEHRSSITAGINTIVPQYEISNILGLLLALSAPCSALCSCWFLATSVVDSITSNLSIQRFGFCSQFE